MDKKLVSWVLPIYNEAQNIPALYTALAKLRTEISEKYDAEFIFVDDGSRDQSLQMLTTLFESDKSVHILSFSRNFGQQLAITAGLDAAKGDAIIFMDADLQDPPEICHELIASWEQGSDVAYAKRRSRQDSFFKKITAFWFYRILRTFAEISIPEDTGDFRLISKQVANVLRSFPERHRFIRGLVSYVGFTQTAVLFDRKERTSGETGYSLKKMIRLAEDAFVGFSVAPIMMIGACGTILSIIGAIAAVIGVVATQLTVAALGYATILTGILMISLATIGQYIGRTFQQVQNRPLYIVKTDLKHE
jgi:dolichol-phosphate mannosyltransferase